MTDPNRNPVVWGLTGYMTVAGLVLVAGPALHARWAQFLGGLMVALLMASALCAVLYIAHDKLRNR